MLFKVYGVPWAGGAPDPLDVLKRFVKAEPKALRLENPRLAPHFEVEITPEELMSMAASKDLDILISGNDYIAFDGKGRGFRQR